MASTAQTNVYDLLKKHADTFKDNLDCFDKAVKLVVLVQVSSAAVERVFSFFNCIVQTTQEHTGMLADQLQLRIFTGVNEMHKKR
jgi:hypothetical protein